MNSHDVYFRTGLHSSMQDLDTDATEYASRLAQHIADEHTDGLGLDDYDASNVGTYGDEDEDCLYVELGEDAIRDHAAAVNAAREGAQ